MKNIQKRLISEKTPYEAHMDIKDREDRVAARIIECLSGFTFQGALDQLDYVKHFLMNRVTMNRLDYRNYLKEQEKEKGGEVNDQEEV